MVVERKRRVRRPNTTSDVERRQGAVEASKKYQQTPRGRYSIHKRNAKKREVPFLLSFDEWEKIWKESGHYEARGKSGDSYVMARFEDEGPYAVGNVRIIPCGENTAERNFTYARRQRRFRRLDQTDDWHHVHSAVDAD